MKPHTFTPQQTAQGILATISRGDWSLAASRLRAAERRADVARIVERSLSRDEREIWHRYYRV